MGHKVNPNILRIGHIQEWNSKYLEKKTAESSTLIFENLEIKKFIFQFFERQGLTIQNCRVFRSTNSVFLYVSYYNSTELLMSNADIKIRNVNSVSVSSKKSISKIRKKITKHKFYQTKNYQNIFTKFSKLKLFQKCYLENKKTHRLSNLKNFKNYSNGKKYETLNHQSKNIFTYKILKSLTLFTNKKYNLFLNFKQVNQESKLLKTVTKKHKKKLEESIVKLRKYQKNDFFKKGFNLLHNFISNPSDPTFIAKFVSSYFRKLKRPNFFLRFLKLTLKTLITQRFSKLERIQIKIQGRFNGAPRSSHKFLNIGKNIPVSTISSNIRYGESTAYTSNGTFGIKVWTYSKN